MIGEISTGVGLIITLWGGYRYFVASRLAAHVEEYAGAARLSVTNNGKHTAYLRNIEVRSPSEAALSTFDPIMMWIVGANSWDAPVEKPPLLVRSLLIDMEVPPLATVTYGFRFWSRSSETTCRIKLDAWESSLIAKRKVIVIPISPKAISISANVDIS